MLTEFCEIFNTKYNSVEVYGTFGIGIYQNNANNFMFCLDTDIFMIEIIYQIPATEKRLIAFKTLWDLAKDKKW